MRVRTRVAAACAFACADAAWEQDERVRGRDDDEFGYRTRFEDLRVELGRRK